jgi:hypothetical protein
LKARNDEVDFRIQSQHPTEHSVCLNLKEASWQPVQHTFSTIFT